jgi:DNA-binding NarL/FixJ family response regulator
VTVTYSVLVVDDYEPWRRRVAAELDKSGRWRVVGECADGADAVREAAALRPDLIVLDIGLKMVNGIEAARRIMAADPAARILFLTGQQSPDVAEAALAAGGRGYLLKSEAGGGLLRAVEAIVAGARFISPGLPPDSVTATAAPANRHRHTAVVHSSMAALPDEYARFAGDALADGRPVVIIAPRTSLERVHARLESDGIAIGHAIDEGRYRVFDMASELARLMPHGRYERERFRESADRMLSDLAKAVPGRRAAICGEMAPHLWQEGRVENAIDLERLWDDVATASGADVLCPYCVDASRLAASEYSKFRDICAVHGAVHVR